MIIPTVELLHARELCNGFIRDALGAAHSLGDRFERPEIFRGQLHDSAAAVAHQNVVGAAVLVDDHIERSVAIAELSNGRADDLRPGLQV